MNFSHLGSTTSITSSLLDYRRIHGRTYQSSHTTEYWYEVLIFCGILKPTNLLLGLRTMKNTSKRLMSRRLRSIELALGHSLIASDHLGING